MYLQPSEVERLPYWQYELLVSEIEDLNKKEKDEQEGQENGYKLPNGMKLPTQRDLQSGKYGGMKLPKVTQPKMPKMPKL